MAEESTFRGMIGLFERLGIYDVVLPFLLIFTIVFAILEKTKVFGTEDYEGKKYPRRNLNSMAAFVIAFFSIASANRVAVITQVSQDVVLVLILCVFFLMLVGSFYQESESGVFLEGAWKTVFMIGLLFAILLIFLNALEWLQPIYGYIVNNWTSNAVASLVFMGIVLVLMMYITQDNRPKKEK